MRGATARRRTAAAGWCAALLGLAGLAGCAGDPPAAPGPQPTQDATPEANPQPDQEPPREPEEEPTVEPTRRPSDEARVSRLTPEVRERMTASHRPGCPVALDDLRLVEVPHVDFDGEVRRGELVVAARYAEDVAGVFERLLEARFPLERVELVDVYGGDDERSMRANNTSAYNCRRVAGTDRWSQHAFGAAIDLNPVQNPYVQASSYSPANAGRFVDVPRGPGAQAAPGVIVDDDVVVRAFAAIGWEWGGLWASSKDYQHFSATGD